MASQRSSFGTLLRRHRMACGLTQEDLAAASGLSPDAIGTLERGTRRVPRRDTAELLADALSLGDADRAAFLRQARLRSDGADSPTRAPRPAARAETPPWPTGNFIGALPEEPLVGRASEYQRLTAMLEKVAAGDGNVVLLAGDPGTGKTRLGQEILVTAWRQGFHVLPGRCYETAQSVPYFPFLEALAAAYDAASPRLRARIPTDFPESARLFAQMSADAPERLYEHGERFRLMRAVTRFVQAFAEEAPLVLALDDLQWADDASLDLMLHLARQARGSRLLILGQYRAIEVHRRHPLEATLLAFARERLAERLQLRPLALQGTADLIAALLKEASVGEELVAAIHEQTEGNPFYVQEVVQALREQGDLIIAEGRWRAHNSRTPIVPESVRSAIGVRISRLDPRTQEVLHAVSVLGYVFRFDDALHLGLWDETALEESLAEATRAHIIRDADRDGFTFEHVLIQQTCYAELRSRQRRHLHRAAAEAILRDRHHARRSAELVRHFGESDQPERALPFALRAGAEAERVYAHSTALDAYRLALDLARDQEDSASVAHACEQGGIISYVLGRFDDAIAFLSEALAIHRAQGHDDEAVRVAAHLGQVHCHRGTIAEGLALVEGVFSTTSTEISPRSLALAYLALARLHTLSRRAHDANLAAALRALSYAQQAGDAALQAHAEMRVATATASAVSLAEGRRMEEQCIARLEALGLLSVLTVAYNNLSCTCYPKAEWDRHLMYAERGFDVAARTGDVVFICHFTWIRGENAFFRGQWPRARVLWESILATPEFQSEQMLPEVLLFMGWLSLCEGGDSEAREYFARLEARPGLKPEERGRMLLCQAEHDLLAGRPEAAEEQLSRVAMDGDLMRLEFESHIWGDRALLQAWAWHLGGDTVKARQLVAEVYEYGRAQDDYFDHIGAVGMLALLAEGDPAEGAKAEAALAHARIICPTGPTAHLDAKTLYRFGALAASLGQRELARERLHAALAICGELGERWYAPHIERALHAI